jgi:predicted nucleic acid-binding protein
MLVLPQSVVIADAGPLIAVARLDLLSLFESLYGTVFVPSVVWQETTGGGDFVEVEAILHANRKGWLKVVDDELPIELDPSSLLWMVDAGERAALVLAINLQKTGAATLLILDDTAARSGAKNFNLSYIGTVGVLLRAKQAGLVPEIVPLVTKLQSSGYFLSDSLLAAVAEIANESLPPRLGSKVMIP